MYCITKTIALSNLGRYQEAIMYYDKVLKIDPEDVDALTGKGVATSNLTPDFKPILYYGKNSDLEAYIYVTVQIRFYQELQTIPRLLTKLLRQPK